MKELLRTNDPVLITYIQSMLAESGIDCAVLDQHTSVLEGSIGAIPQRIMVLEQDLSQAKWIVNTADGLEGWFDKPGT